MDDVVDYTTHVSFLPEHHAWEYLLFTRIRIFIVDLIGS